jgi:hypothetical protein
MFVSMDSSVGIATCYGLNGPGIESPLGRDFPHLFRLAGDHTRSYLMGTGSFPGVMRQRQGADHQPPSSAEVKERVQVYIYSSSGPVLG